MAVDPGQIMSDIQAGVNAANGVRQLFSGVNVSRRDSSRKDNEKALRDALGEWGPYAKPDPKSGRWHRPFLKEDSFMAHLQLKCGHFGPLTGSSNSIFAWAHLLFALDITPSSGRVEWSPVLAADDAPVALGSLPLIVDGRVLCHIINLYRIYREPSPQSGKRQETPQRYDLPFGNLALLKNAPDVLITFQRDVPSELNKLKKPFRVGGTISHGVEDNHLKARKEVVVKNYRDAMENKISDSSLGFPASEDDLSGRIEKLVAVLKELRNTDSSKSYIATALWMKQATRTYRRVTSNDSTASTLPADIADALFSKDLEKMIATDALTRRCMIKSQELELLWADSSELQSSDRAQDMALVEVGVHFDELRDKFKDASKGTPQGVLVSELQEMMYLLTDRMSHPQIFSNAPCVLLEFDKRHELYRDNPRCHVLCYNEERSCCLRHIMH